MVCVKSSPKSTGSSSEDELERIEVLEPEIESGAENAALTVIASTAFGALIWAVLGKTKAEGELSFWWRLVV